MGKVILTEGQYERLKKKLINNMINEVDAGSVATGFMLGGVTGAALAFINSAAGSRAGVQKMFQACSAKGMGKSTMAGSTLDEIAAKIREAISGAGTWETNVYNALIRVQTIPDLCALITRYAENYPGSTLWDDLDGDFDSDSEWNEYIYTPLLKAKRKSQEIANQAAAKAKAAGAGGGGAGVLNDRYYMALFAELQKMGVGVKADANGRFLYWGPWIIWKDQSKNGGYPIQKGTGTMTGPNKTAYVYKLLDGKYAGQPLDTLYVTEKDKPGVPIKLKELLGGKTITKSVGSAGGGGSKPKPKAKPVASTPSTPTAPSFDYGSGLK